MDRVLLAFDDIQYAGHLEMALRKVGFDVESITNEYNLSEKLLSFNPDIILVKGNSNRLSSVNIGRKLKESLRFSGKVVLIFNPNQKMHPDDMARMRMDLLLFEPLGALKLTLHVLSLDPERRELMKDKLYRLAESDPKFRQQEQEYLSPFGIDLDQELVQVDGQKEQSDNDLLIDDSSLEVFVPKDEKPKGALKPEDLELPSPVPGPSLTPAAKNSVIVPQIESVSESYKIALAEQLLSAQEELPLRIESYNREIKKIDGDLKKGLKKRHTRSEQKKLNAGFAINPGLDKLDSLDKERQRFAKSLFKKDK